jgi:hypothetical protein
MRAVTVIVATMVFGAAAFAQENSEPAAPQAQLEAVHRIARNIEAICNQSLISATPPYGRDESGLGDVFFDSVALDHPLFVELFPLPSHHQFLSV